MKTEKKHEKYKRIKYIRELERFVNKSVNYLGQKDITKKSFADFIDKIFKNLEEIDKVILSSEYLSELEQFAEKIANIPGSEKSIEEIKNEILYEANRLRKLKRKKSYSKDKYKNLTDDWE
ncbi:hypothetical protein [Nitrosophilus alvini]|uniref:hypothetical protein n=1 Tax=Nitrosophilus alvini TaxID=2714855 RepID=UPI00190D6ABD|nr:hypothetical protein [Nitrosophilus alvini]